EKVTLSILKEMPSINCCCSIEVKLALSCGCANAVPDKFRPIPFIETIIPATKKNDIARQNVKCDIDLFLLLTDE
ncbi:MAG: hypothetical protein WBV72_01875, partial [Nitrososphaeraceae archaeon]